MDVKNERQDSRGLSAEMAVIGSLCIDPEPVAGILFHKLRPEDFGDATYRNIYAAARNIWLEQRPLDPVTIAAAAGKDYAPVIAEAMKMTPTAVNAEGYADIVVEEGQLRRLREIGMQLSLHLNDLDTGRKLLAEAEGLLAAQREERVWSYKAMLESYLDRQQSKEKLDFLDWGIPELNEKVKISQGRFVILGAPSSTGKTAFALQLAYNIARAGKRVGFFSYETSQEDAADRLFANTADVSMQRTKTKTLTSVDYDALYKEGDISMELPLTLEDSGDWNVDDIRARTLAMRYEVIFIDYVQIIPGDAKRPRWEVVTDISMKLHRMAQKLGVTVIALSQVTPQKDSKGKRIAITKESLRESQQLANDAEAVLLMDLTVQGDYGSERELRVDKNKDGSRGKMWLKFDPQHMRFSSCEKPEHMKRKEYQEKMAAVRKERKAQRQAELTQMGFEDLGGRSDDLPF